MSAVSQNRVVLISCDEPSCGTELRIAATGEFGPAYDEAKRSGWRFSKVGADAACPGHADVLLELANSDPAEAAT